MGNIFDLILNHLRQSEYWTDKTLARGDTIRNLICPECGDKTAWAYSKEPWSINCNRMNECGIRTKTLSLFPEIVRNIEKEHKPTKEDPLRPATVYLQSRGLSESLKGLSYEYWPNIRKTDRGGVMFKVADDLHNGRIFNPPAGEGKTHNQGSTSGKFWKHPGLTYNPTDETFIVEGIIDALSLVEIGYQAIAILSSGQDPSKVDLSEFKNLVFACDSDRAGTSALRKWKKHYPDLKAIVPISGDWNDLLLSNRRDKAREYFQERRPEFECRAKLAIVENAESYARAYSEFYKHTPGLFIFDGCYHYTPGDPDKTYRVSNFTLEVDHYQLDTTNSEEPVNRYFLKIKPRKGRTIPCIVSASELASPNGLTQMFLQRARVLWEGDRKPSMALTRRIVEAGASVVRQLQVQGYDKESNYYVFRDFAINPKGEIILPNQKGFFEVSRSGQIRPAQYPTVKPALSGVTPKEIYNLIYQAWGNQGTTGVAWAVAGWFVRQIKEQIGFFPFLSFYGDTQVGKTVLTRYLNALQCFDEEGLPMRKVNTGKGEIRKLAQRAGLFKALLETTTEENSRFDLDGILTLYNDNPLQVRALKSNDIQTVEIPFLSSLLFVQNREPFRTKAQKERVVSLQFKETDLTPETTAAFNKLIQIPIAEMAYFFPFIMRHRQAIESGWYDAFQRAKEDIGPAIGDARITENHALILGFHRLLCGVLNVSYDLKPYIEKIGQAKKRECRSRVESVADIFFDVLNRMDSNETWFMDIDKEKGRLFVNLDNALQKIKDDRINFPVQLKDIQTSLREHPAYLTANERHYFSKRSGQNTESIRLRAWIFDINKILDKVDTSRASHECPI